MDYEVKKIVRTDENSPNVLAVVNFPGNIIPARGYIFDSHIDETYGSVNEAADYFARRVSIMPEKDALFILGFLFGNKNDRGMTSKDIFVYPWEYSADGNKRIRTIPYLIKDGVMQPWKIREKEDFWPILDAERAHFRAQQTFEGFSRTFPRIQGLEILT